MKKLMGAAALALLLAGCNDEKQVEAGNYLFESAQITFDNRNTGGSEQGRDALQKEMNSTLNETGKGFYYDVTPTEITSHGYGETLTGSVAEGRVKLQGAWHTIKPEGNNTLRLITDNDLSCGFYTCQITLTLKKVAPDSPELRARQQLYDARFQAWQKRIASERDEFMRTPMPDSPGTLFSPVEGFTLKLPWRYQKKARQERMFQGFRLQIDRLTIENVNEAYFTEQGKLTRAFLAQSDEERLQNPAQRPGFISPMGWELRDSAQGLNLNFYVINGKKEDIDLTRWLATQNDVIFRAQNGAVYYGNSDNLQVIYLQYDEATQRHFIGLGEAKSVATAARTFAILRTVDARYRGKDVVTLDELTLPRALQEARYQTTRESLLNSVMIHQRINNLLEQQLEKPYRSIGEPKRVHKVHIAFKSASIDSYDFEMVLDTRSVSALMAEAKKLHPEGKVAGDLFINGDSYNLYREMGNGMTLIFTVPDDVGNRVERIMLLSTLRGFDMAMLPHVPTAERKNLLKYSVDGFLRGEPSDRFFVVNEGIIDRQGNLVMPTPEDGYLNIKDQETWLLVRKWKTQGEAADRKTPEMFIYNAEGKLQLHVANFGELMDNRLVAGGDGKKQGLYDLNARRWLTAQAWDEIKWKDGLLIASDYEYSESGARGWYLRQALLDTGGNVLATGHYIDILRKTDRVTVNDGKGHVSLIDRQGRVLFSHPGHSLDWIPQINAYSVLISPPGTRKRSLGIFSEQGETILPMEYGHLEVVGDRLKVWMPDMKTVVWFDVEQVKNWRENQPLKQVPAPQ